MGFSLPRKISFDKETIRTFIAGILTVLLIKKLIVNFEEIIFGLFPSAIPEWGVILILIFIIYYLLGYGK